jgi:hypothetical protein
MENPGVLVINLITMKKAAVDLPLKLVFSLIVFSIILILALSGVLSKLVVQLGLVSQNIDTSSIELCHQLSEEEIGDSKAYELLSDLDNDKLADYLCDTCICKDGKNGEYCKYFNQEYTRIEGLPNNLFGQAPEFESVQPRCTRDDDEVSCLTTLKNDIDDDFLPGICDRRPLEYDKKRRCYEGDIIANGRKLGFMHTSNIVKTNQYQCVLTLCTKNAVFEDPKEFESNCEWDEIWEIEGTQVVTTFSNSQQYEEWIEALS